MNEYEGEYYKEALGSMRAVASYYFDVIEALVAFTPGHESFGETKNDGSDYCECGQFLGHDFPPEQTELRWLKHKLAMLNITVEASQ